MTVGISFKYESKKNAIIFRFEWEFTNENTSQIFADIKKLINEKWHSNTIFNMWGIEYINSRTAWWIADVFETIESYSWKIYVTNMNEFTQDSLELLGMFLFINKSETEEKALIELSK